MFKNLLSIAFVFLMVGCNDNNTIQTPEDNPSEKKTVIITVDGRERSYIIYLPSGYNNKGNLPCIFMFHGGGADAESMFSGTSFGTIAERDKIILVSPQGISNSWNDGRTTEANKQGVDDINFIRVLVNEVISKYPVDSKKIYATGISNGGFMCSRIGCELSDKFAAFAAVAATMGESIPYSSCNPTNSMPCIYIHGTADPVIPFDGGVPPFPSTQSPIVSHYQVISKWVANNQCDTIPQVNSLPDIANDGTTVQEKKYSGGKNGSVVISYVINNGGHTWPQGQQYLPESIIGKVCMDMNASQVIWDFFKQFHR
jgi:polyhydroxybutyrate depolymerase